MLTKRQNFTETIRGGKPDRFVDQYEALGFIFGNPVQNNRRGALEIGGEIVDPWGVTIRFPPGTPGPFPVHDDEHKVIKDITKWREQLKIPSLDFPQAAWDAAKPAAEAIDRNEVFAAIMLAPGVFDMTHYLMGMEDALIAYYEEPEAMHELIDAITDYELRYAKLLCDNYHPDAIFHHDDWGSHRSTFLSPEMFREFIFPSYRKIYGYYKDHGVELIFHHSDSYAATLIEDMIDMQIDVFQGCVDTNNVPELIRKYGGKISFMGAINNGIVDVPDWTPKLISDTVEQVCRDCGRHYFIPCCTAGGPGSAYPGVYEAVSSEIARMSAELF
ncbi:MAG: uroporphyrinogen decarboxylase [Oscillospiraceae bacterium]|jgi:uroporphyrinogen-III decarboxylase|nr:uroporphyrinogen decarboxylase [Oscillospiraceae bacterium]